MCIRRVCIFGYGISLCVHRCDCENGKYYDKSSNHMEKNSSAFLFRLYVNLYHDKLIKIHRSAERMAALFNGGKISFSAFYNTYKSTCTMKCYIFSHKIFKFRKSKKRPFLVLFETKHPICFM